MSNEVLSKEQQSANQQLFLTYQKEYNTTHDVNIVWFKLLPLIRLAMKPAILKLNKHNEVKDFEDKLEDAILLLITRYINNADYNYGSLATLCYWAAISVCRKKNVIAAEKYNLSYEEMIEKMIHQQHMEELYESF